MSSSLLTTGELNPIVNNLKANGCKVEKRPLSGVIEVRDGDVSVLMAIQKGRNQPSWIVRFFESERIKWKEKT